MTGKFIISLDYELHWGFFDLISLNESKSRLNNVNFVIDKLLEMSDAHQIKLTFATVGFLFAKDKADALNYIPNRKPEYQDQSLDAYELYNNISSSHLKYYFANETVQRIKNHTDHELGTHTFSHYYCSENGQSIEDFKSDLSAAITIAQGNANTQIESIVFPRNQTHPDYVDICQSMGIKAYRGNCWFNFNNSSKKLSILDIGRIGLRVLDTYINISGSNSFNLEKFNSKDASIINIPASRFLRPYHKKLKFAEPLKIKRILKGMTKAAKQGKVYHLWWHPHNFAEDIEENFKNLKRIYQHYSELKKAYNFESYTMSETARKFKT